MSKSLFFHETTKPLALASSAVSDSFICGQKTSAYEQQPGPPKQQNLAVESSGVGESSVRLGCLHSYTTSQTRALLSTCDVAALPSFLLVLLGKTGI